MKKPSNLLKLSASAIKTYQTCARKYFYTYIEKLPKKEWEHLTLGTFVHAVLEQFHNALMADPTLDHADLMTKCFAEQIAKYELKRESKIKAHQMITTYLAVLHKGPMPLVESNERSFSIKIDEDLLIRGFIDRVDIDPNGGKIIRDYKTGKSKYLDEFQLLVYGLMLLEDNPDLQTFRGDYIALAEGSKSIQYRFTRTDLDRVREKIRMVAQEIRTDQTWAAKPSFLCNYCDFEAVCPAAKGAFKKIGATGLGDNWTQTSKND